MMKGQSMRTSLSDFARVVAVLGAVSLMLTGCATQDGQANKQQTGAILGAILGAALGSQIGDGRGNTAAILAGAALGAAAGGAIGRELDEADRIRAQAAATRAANAQGADRIIWESEKNPGVHGYAEPASPAKVVNNDLCKDVRSVYVIDGQEKAETSRFCFRNGAWSLA